MDLSLPPRRLRPDTRPEHQDPVSHMVQKKRNRENKNKQKKTKSRQNPRTNGKSQPIQTKSHKEAYTYTFTKREKGKNIYILNKKGREKPNDKQIHQ